MLHYEELARVRRHLLLLGFKPTGTSMSHFHSNGYYVAVASYGFKMYKEENMVKKLILSTTSSHHVNRKLGEIIWAIQCKRT